MLKNLKIKSIFISSLLTIIHVTVLAQTSDDIVDKMQKFDLKINQKKYFLDKFKNKYSVQQRYRFPGENIPILKTQHYIVDSTVIDPYLIDTINFKFNYKFWGKFDFTNWYRFLGNMQFGDYNKNGRTEIFAYQSNPQKIGPVKVFEIDSTKKLKVIFTYPDSVVCPQAQYDIDNDGYKDVVLNTNGSRGIFVYSSSDTNPLPNVQKLLFSYNPDRQVTNIMFNDFDGNGKADLLFTVNTDTGGVKIYEYDKSINNFIPIFSQLPDNSWAGYTIGDFDLDGKKEIVYSTTYGLVHIVECEGEHKYSHIFSFQTELTNAYHQFKTNDIDGNGKPEFWIGGNDFSIPFSYKLICFEADSDNTYSPKKSIIFLNSFGYPNRKISSVDIDGDGKEEIFVGLDNHLYLLSYSKMSSKFKSIFYKRIPFNDADNEIEDVNFYDLFNTGSKDMLVSILRAFGNNPGDPYEEKTEIYRIERTSEVVDKETARQKFELKQNYPNPFNPTTTIWFSLSKESFISINVTDILGRRIKTLVNDKYKDGNYQIDWDGKNDSGVMMNSGVYFISLQSNTIRKTIKTMLLK